jgi:hypothetical protein
MTPFVGMIFLLFPLVSEAGRINNIFFDSGAAIITIRHNGCQLKPPFKSNRKLILPMAHCASNAGKIYIKHPDLKKIHWAQHDPKTVWIVATFSGNQFQYEIASSPHQYQICIPSCESQKSQTDRLSDIRKQEKMMFDLNGVLFQIPLQDMLIDEFLDRSIGYLPKNLVRDGLPHFGSKRDDWKGKKRKHKGYDIYANKINVVAAADGTVTRVRRSTLAGLYVKLHHGNKLYTLYIHLTSASVKRWQKVKRGDVIGRINGPSGNAVEPQLHFEIKPYNRSVDPLALIKSFYQADTQIMDKIRGYESTLQQSIQRRNLAVDKFLKSQPLK